MDKTVGIVGLGIMGSAIARNLIERGWKVVGYDIDAARRAELALANVTIAADVTQVARGATVKLIVSCCRHATSRWHRLRHCFRLCSATGRAPRARGPVRITDV